MSIRLYNNSGGYIDMDAAGDGSTANTFTLPAETGTLLTSASSLNATSLTGNVAAARIVSALNAEGSAPIYACRAWVNFNGTGTVAIRASGNVTSITDHAAGNYGINMTTAMPDTNYAVTGTCSQDSDNSRSVSLGFDSYSASPTTSVFRINTRNLGGGGAVDVDCPIVSVSVFR